MIQERPPEFIKALAHDLRWSLLRALAGGDYRVHELVDAVHEPMNLVSYHLKKLRADGLVNARRSDADGRDVYYALDLTALRELYQAAGRALHPALGGEMALPAMATDNPLRLLFVCTHNSARSQMGEAFARHLAPGRVEVYSAGSHPRAVHPEAMRVMDGYGIDIRGQRPHSLDDYAGQTFDYVITVCDRAREVCPAFPGGQQVHWSFPDPAEAADDVTCAFDETAARLRVRVGYFLAAVLNR